MRFFSSLAVALLALPALATPGAAAESQPQSAAQPMSPAPALEDRTFFSCSNLQRAACYVMGMDMDSNCLCRFSSSKVPQPCGDKSYTTCKSIISLSSCWDKGMIADGNCRCVSSSTSTPPPTTTPSGQCHDFIKIAMCALAGKKTDGNCNCVSGTASHPGGSGWQSCGDATKVGNCWKQGWGCSAKCVCETPSDTCDDFVQIARCAFAGKKADNNCNCVSGTPSHPGGSGWQTCGDASKVGNCWKQGWGCNAKCVCETPSATTKPPAASTTAAGQCRDFVQIAMCALAGKKTDGNCNCVTGTPTHPGGSGWQTCGDANKVGNCWKQGWGCNAKCVCETPSASTTPPATSTPAGQCHDFVKIALCALAGKKTDGNCNCVAGTPTHPGGSGWQTCGDANKVGNCWKQGWGCNAKCVCETPSASTAPPATSTPAGQCHDFVQIALCALAGKKTDGNCKCVTGTPTHPGGSGWQTCGDANKVGNCWKQGWGCNAKCVCETPSTSTTPAPTTSTPVPGKCLDWYKIAVCHLKGMKTDGNCACVPGTPTVPGGGSDCKDPDALSKCWKVGYGCNARCVCEPITSTTPKPSTSTTPAPTTSTPVPGKCLDWYKIAICHLKGMKTDGNCACVPGTPTVPGGGSDCKDPDALSKCWKVGYGCNARCVCEPITSTTPKPSTSTTPVPTTSAPAGHCYDWYKVAICHLKGMKTDSNCNCIPGKPTVPGGGSDCKDPNALAKCWKVGYGCNARCVCEPTTTTTPTTPTTTPPPGKCLDWYKIAICHLKGMKTDGNCNCIPGTPTVPGGGSDCKDPNALAKCWKVGYGCNARCVCITTTTTATPPPTPTVVGQCKDTWKINYCASRGLGVNADCSCNKCECRAQWDCHRRGGTYDSSSCKCVVPTGGRKRRDADYINNMCPETHTACRVDSAASGWDGRFECVDTSRNIESCGGCVAEGMGTDCTALEGVNDVACVASRCVVSTCLPGYSLVNGVCQPALTAQKTIHQRGTHGRRNL